MNTARLLPLVGICALIVAALAPKAQAQRTAEHEVKAAFLFNFAKFVDWPGDTRGDGGAFAICIAGADPFGPALDSVVRNAQVGGQMVIVRRLTTGEVGDDCRVLFVSRSEERRVSDLLAAIAGRPVLTVSDMPEFLGRGGMIQLLTRDGRVRFEVNLPPADAAGLRVRSDLLRVASAVRKGSERPR